MAMTTLRLRRARPEDIAFCMATERLDGFDAVVGRWDEAVHRAALADGRHAYFLVDAGSDPMGFAIVRDWGSTEQVMLLKRIAVSQPGKGLGRRFLAEIVDHAFLTTDVHRLWLGVFPENLRAQQSYRAVGFVAEGVARGSAYFGGIHRDELIMSILRTDWTPRVKP